MSRLRNVGRWVGLLAVLFGMTFTLGVPAAAVWTWYRVWKVWAVAAGIAVTFRLASVEFVVAGRPVEWWIVSGSLAAAGFLFGTVFMLITVRAWARAWEELALIRADERDYGNL